MVKGRLECEGKGEVGEEGKGEDIGEDLALVCDWTFMFHG